MWGITMRKRLLGRASVAALIAVLGLGATVALTADRIYASILASEAQLLGHVVRLEGPSILAGPPTISESVALDKAAETAMRATNSRHETFWIDTPYAPGAHSKTSWLVLFEGGPEPPSFGPADGGPATFSTTYTGVIIDDTSGAVVFWFGGGSFNR